MKSIFTPTNAFVFIISFLIFFSEYHLPFKTDISEHLNIIKDINEKKYLPGHFGYFLLVSILSFYSMNTKILMITSSLILSFFVTLKKHLTEKIMKLISYNNVAFSKYIPTISTMLIFFTLLPSKPPFYLPWPPISWLNSTMISVFPFSIMLFYYSFNFIIQKNNVFLLKIIFLSIIILVFKPSYLFVFIIAFPLMYFLQERKFTSNFLKTILISGFILCLIYLQYIYIYHYLLFQLNLDYSNTDLIIKPFSAWSRISSNILISFILWFGFPITLIILFYEQLFKEKIFIYALINFIIGLIIFIVFEEVNKSTLHPYGSVNFLWQVLITFYILIIISVSIYLKNLQFNNLVKFKNIIVCLTFIYYFASGIMYLYNTIFKCYLK